MGTALTMFQRLLLAGHHAGGFRRRRSSTLNKGHLTKLWTWLAVAAVLFLATSVISLQGGTEFVGSLFGQKGGAPVANFPGIGYFGVIVGGGLLFLASVPLLLHVRRHGSNWHSRIPVVWLEGLDTSVWEGKLFQICVVLLLVISPIVSLVSCYRVAEAGDICEQNRKNFYDGNETNLFWAPVSKDGQQMRLRKSGSADADCTSGVEIFPRSWTPLFFYIIPFTALLLNGWALALLFAPRNAHRPSNPGGASAGIDVV